MKKKVVKTVAVGAVASVLALSTALSACGNKGGAVIIDFGSLMPTENTTPTADNPEVIQSTRYIIDSYMEEKGVELEWAKNYGRNPSDNIDKITAWYGQQVTTGNCPIIGFTSLNMLQELDYYVALDEYLEKPNPYVEGNVKWKDIFRDYVWDDASLYNIKGELVAIPVLLSAGAQTGVYYNKTIFEDESKDIPQNWGEFKTLIGELDQYRPFVPYTGYTKPGLYQWAFEFNLTPNVLAFMRDTDNEAYAIDYNNDGKLTDLEVLQGVAEGKFDPTVAGPAQSVYMEAYDYYKNTLEAECPGWGTYQYVENWALGKVAMWDNGLWNITMENSNTTAREKFDYGIFSTPLAGKETYNDYANETKYYDKTGFSDIANPVSVAFNVMKPAIVNEDGTVNQERLDLAIDILMYVTAEQNCSQIAVEKGGTLGAVKNSKYNPALDDENLGWTAQKFPQISYSAKWPTGYTSQMSGKINDDFEKWVKGSKMDDETFLANLKKNQLTGAKLYVSTFGIDTASWNLSEDWKNLNI